MPSLMVADSFFYTIKKAIIRLCWPRRRVARRAPCRHWLALIAMGFAIILGGCREDPEPEQVTTPRPVLTRTIQFTEAHQERIFAGRLRAERRSELAFNVGGTVASVAVDVGSLVDANELLIRLDETPFRLRVDQARAALERAEAELDERQYRASVQRELSASGWTPRTALHTAETALNAAEAAAGEARAALRLAERDLANAGLRAPYPGRIAQRLVEPEAEVVPAQTVLIIDGVGDLEIVASVPASIVGHLDIGHAVAVQLGGGPQAIPAILSQIGNREGAGLTVEVVAILLEGSKQARPGAVAELILPMPAFNGITMPPGAVVPSDQPERGYVFVFDREKQIVARRMVTVRGGRSQSLLITEGLETGDEVVTAGASFLTDGQPAIPLEAR